MSYLENAGAWVIGGVGAIYGFVTGNFDVATQVLIWAMLIDILSGVLKGLQKRRLKSAIMSMGILKKGGILLSIVFAYVLDQAVNGGQPVFAPMMTWVSVGNESISIFENLTTLGVKIPPAITDRLGQFTQEAVELHEEKDAKGISAAVVEENRDKVVAEIKEENTEVL